MAATSICDVFVAAQNWGGFPSEEQPLYKAMGCDARLGFTCVGGGRALDEAKLREVKTETSDRVNCAPRAQRAALRREGERPPGVGLTWNGSPAPPPLPTVPHTRPPTVLPPLPTGSPKGGKPG